VLAGFRWGACGPRRTPTGPTHFLGTEGRWEVTELAEPGLHMVDWSLGLGPSFAYDGVPTASSWASQRCGGPERPQFCTCHALSARYFRLMPSRTWARNRSRSGKSIRQLLHSPLPSPSHPLLQVAATDGYVCMYRPVRPISQLYTPSLPTASRSC